MADLRCSSRKCLLFVIAAVPILGPKIKDCTEEGGAVNLFPLLLEVGLFDSFFLVFSHHFPFCVVTNIRISSLDCFSHHQ